MNMKWVTRYTPMGFGDMQKFVRSHKPRVRVIKVSGKDMFVANTCVGFVASYKWSLLWAKANNPHHFPNGLVNPTLCKRMAIGGPLLVYRP